jgi:hypothetical protein
VGYECKVASVAVQEWGKGSLLHNRYDPGNSIWKL